jgi:hypothetical protein
MNVTRAEVATFCLDCVEKNVLELDQGSQRTLDVADASSHTGGMTSSVKIAVSLPAQVAERARRAVRKGHARSVSAYVASALDEKAKLDELATLLSEMLAESGGPLNAAERRAADRALGMPAKPARKGRRRL